MTPGKEIDRLVEGYRTFRRGTWEPNRSLYQKLADQGQSPKIMIIGCCDSRVDPAVIFGAGPGELFVVRNVANLVPPCEPYGDYHGTSAALEFAVTGLEVKHIIVLGHAHCGGIEAFLKRLREPDSGGQFIAKWVSMIKPAEGAVLNSLRGKSDKAAQRLLEQASIFNSLDNLLTFPFVRDRLRGDRLQLHGWYFDITTGELMAQDSTREEFVSVA